MSRSIRLPALRGLVHNLHLSGRVIITRGGLDLRNLVAGRNGPGRRMRLLVGIVAAGLMATGCGAPAAPPHPVKLTSAEVTVLTGAVDPVNTAEVSNAFQLLVERCMESKGFLFYPAFVTAAAVTHPRQVPGVPGAAISLAQREAHGYGFYSQAVQNAAHPDSQPGVGKEEKYADSLTGAFGIRYRLALDGSDSQRIEVLLPGGGILYVPDAGCFAVANRRLYGSVANSAEVTTGWSLLYDNLYNTVTSAPKFAALAASWSSCMAGRGLAYGSPAKLWNSLAKQIYKSPTPAGRDLEIRVAVADYRCSATVNLVPAVQRLEQEKAQYLSSPLAQYLALVTRVDVGAASIAQSLNPPQ